MPTALWPATQRMLPLLAMLFCAGSNSVRAYDKTAHGIVVSVGPARVELAVAPFDIFRISATFTGDPHPSPSLFLAPTPSAAGSTAAAEIPWDAVTDGSKVGIKTPAGQLLIDPTSGAWSLQAANGDFLIKDGLLLEEQTRDAKTGVAGVALTITTGTEKPFKAYGSGNGTKTLLKTDGKSRLSNGRATIPYYWCDHGYAAFGVSGDDDSPARWSANARLGMVTWSFPGQSADLYLLPAADLHQAAEKYADLTGHPEVPPRWTFGYLQSRWGWTDKAYIDATLQTFRAHQLPVDAFIFDFECYAKKPDYTLPPAGAADFPDFTWNPVLFPDPATQIAGYGKQGLRIVPIRKPRIGDSATLDLFRQKGWLLVTGKNGEKANKSAERGINFENPDARKWYGDHLKGMIDDGVAGWWNDEGESAYTKYYEWNQAEADALATYRPGARHWSLNRSYDPGLQRFGVSVWTGDIKTDWATLADTPLSILNLGLAGMPYGACDIGGFSGNPSPELLARWMELGVFLPVMRSHSVVRVQPRFPWLYGAEAENAIRQALDLRYRLIPFYYSLAHEAHADGLPLMRPLAMEFPADPQVAGMADEWLMGDGLLAAPLLTEGGHRTVYLPAGKWYDFNDDDKLLDGAQTLPLTAELGVIPIYVRAGTLLPMGPVVPDTDQLPGGPLELQIYPGKDAVFTLVEDDGISYDYLQGKVRKTTFNWNDANRTLTWQQEGTYQGTDVFTQLHAVLEQAGAKKSVDQPLGADGTCQF